MIQAKTERIRNTRQIHVHPETYKTLRHMAVDRNVRLMEVVEDVIKAGLHAIRSGDSELAES